MAIAINFPTIFSELYTVALFFSSLLLLKLRVLLRSTSGRSDSPTTAPTPHRTRVGSIEAKYPAVLYITEEEEEEEGPKSAAAECAVCLSEFRGGESVRRLDCKHLFHRDCLDRWLTSPAGFAAGSSCPLCRTRLDLATAEEEEEEQREKAAAVDDCGGEWGRREMFALLAKFREDGRRRW